MLEEIYLVHHTHMDVGYTDLAPEVLDQHLNSLDLALDLVEGNAGRPPESRYYWTCESALLIREYLSHRPAPQRERLLRALREGWIEAMAFLTQPLTELPTVEELIQCVGYAAELGRREDFPVQCAMIDDIGGYAGRLPTILNGWGVRYLVAGVGGFQVHLPWADLPHLFYLEARDGARVLVWNLGVDRDKMPQVMNTLDAVYSFGGTRLIAPYRKHRNEAQVGAPPPGRLAPLAELEERLAREGYALPVAMLQHAYDNLGPDVDLAEVIAHINSSSEAPRVRFTTPTHFFRRMEAEFGARIPVIRGVMADPWNLRAVPVPSALKRFRQAQRILAAADARLALQPEAPCAAEDAATRHAVMDNLHLYADHTYGLSEWDWEKRYDPERGCRDVTYDRYRNSWATKHFYAEAALRGADGLDRAARGRLGGEIAAAGRFVLVWNDSPEPIQGPAEIYLGRGGRGLTSLTDAATGAPVPYQCIGPNRYLLLPPEVPSLGYRVLCPTFADRGASPAPPPPAGEVLENEHLCLRFDLSTGQLRSVRQKESGRELLDGGAVGLGDFLYQHVTKVPFRGEQAGMGKDWHRETLPVHCDSVSRGLDGPVAQSMVIEGHVDGPAGRIGVRREITLYANAPRVEVRVRLDKPESAEKECCYVAFPFAGSEGVFRFDQNLGVVTPAEELIPGAMQDLFFCHSFASVWEGQGGVTVACPDAPALQFGRVRTGEWEDRLPFVAGSNRMVALLYHNLLNTDDAIWQDLLDEFRFGVEFHDGEFSLTESRCAAATVSRPLRAELRFPNPGGARVEPVASLLEVSPAAVTVASLHRAEAGTLRLRLVESAGERQSVRVTLGVPVQSAWLEDFFGQRQGEVFVEQGNTLLLELAPHALVTIGLAPAEATDRE